MKLGAWVQCGMFVAGLLAGNAGAAPPGGPTLPEKEWKAIQRVISAQLGALKAGDGGKAMTYASPGIRAQFGTPDGQWRIAGCVLAPSTVQAT